MTQGSSSDKEIAAKRQEFYADTPLGQMCRERDRARLLAKHLFQMIDRQAWRDSGGDDGQGHYEGDYHAARIEEEIRSWEN